MCNTDAGVALILIYTPTQTSPATSQARVQQCYRNHKPKRSSVTTIKKTEHCNVTSVVSKPKHATPLLQSDNVTEIG